MCLNFSKLQSQIHSFGILHWYKQEKNVANNIQNGKQITNNSHCMYKIEKFRGLCKATGRAGNASRIKMQDKIIIIQFTLLVDCPVKTVCS